MGITLSDPTEFISNDEIDIFYSRHGEGEGPLVETSIQEYEDRVQGDVATSRND
jgi:hypothetical protein